MTDIIRNKVTVEFMSENQGEAFSVGEKILEFLRKEYPEKSAKETNVSDIIVDAEISACLGIVGTVDETTFTMIEKTADKRTG